MDSRIAARSRIVVPSSRSLFEDASDAVGAQASNLSCHIVVFAYKREMAGRNERSQRKLAFLKAKIRAGDEWRDVTIMNVSATGFMAKAPVIPKVGDTVHVQHRGTSIVGEVVWATRTRFGVRSEGMIDLGSLMAQAGIASNKSEVEQGSDRSRWWHWRSRG